ncbi:MAG: glycosyltransferase N-terminal domain-containing protein [Mucilaginibacter sp.]
MRLIYNIGVRLYFLVVYLASFFNPKAKLWIHGRKNQSFISLNGCIWFHFASLGEFEQGRSVLEQLKLKNPENKIVITFFSPSGYEIRKNTPLADAVYYLPLDTQANARQFIDALKPKMVVFTKYEYWYHFFHETHRRNIPLYIISSVFRPGQVFFKWYGSLHRKMLGFVSHFFVQDEGSKILLQQLNIQNVTVSGDTRFDRVWANAQQPKEIALVNEFKNGHKVFIAGSTWPQDEQLIATLVTQYPDWKFIIAPHEIGEEKIKRLIDLLPEGTAVRYSQLSALTGSEDDLKSQTSNFKSLIIDNVGMLSSLYQYGDIAYIGGGFGAGIHNTLEAAAFGLPIIFGPNYSKFKEAHDLIALQTGFSIVDEAELEAVICGLAKNDVYKITGEKAKVYVVAHMGATAVIINHIKNKTPGA